TRTLAEVSAAGMSQRVIYTSFDSRVLDEIRTRQPAARVGILSMLMPRESIEVARQKGYNYVALGNPVLEQEEIAEAHEAGVGVLLWFPNSEEQDWDQCAAGLVDGIITDHVSRTLKIAQPEARPCRIRNQDDVVPDFGNSW
ncbi:MAG: glycerophosphodiester phosphodiesterase, partial [Bdellovibrionota bacterium]